MGNTKMEFLLPTIEWLKEKFQYFDLILAFGQTKVSVARRSVNFFLFERY
jgi:hypothetical protein